MLTCTPRSISRAHAYLHLPFTISYTLSMHVAGLATGSALHLWHAQACPLHASSHAADNTLPFSKPQAPLPGPVPHIRICSSPCPSWLLNRHPYSVNDTMFFIVTTLHFPCMYHADTCPSASHMKPQPILTNFNSSISTRPYPIRDPAAAAQQHQRRFARGLHCTATEPFTRSLRALALAASLPHLQALHIHERASPLGGMTDDFARALAAHCPGLCVLDIAFGRGGPEPLSLPRLSNTDAVRVAYTAADADAATVFNNTAPAATVSSYGMSAVGSGSVVMASGVSNNAIHSPALNNAIYQHAAALTPGTRSGQLSQDDSTSRTPAFGAGVGGTQGSSIGSVSHPIMAQRNSSSSATGGNSMRSYVARLALGARASCGTSSLADSCCCDVVAGSGSLSGGSNCHGSLSRASLPSHFGSRSSSSSSCFESTGTPAATYPKPGTKSGSSNVYSSFNIGSLDKMRGAAGRSSSCHSRGSSSVGSAGGMGMWCCSAAFAGAPSPAELFTDEGMIVLAERCARLQVRGRGAQGRAAGCYRVTKNPEFRVRRVLSLSLFDCCPPERLPLQ